MSGDCHKMVDFHWKIYDGDCHKMVDFHWKIYDRDDRNKNFKKLEKTLIL